MMKATTLKHIPNVSKIIHEIGENSSNHSSQPTAYGIG